MKLKGDVEFIIYNGHLYIVKKGCPICVYKGEVIFYDPEYA